MTVLTLKGASGRASRLLARADGYRSGRRGVHGKRGEAATRVRGDVRRLHNSLAKPRVFTDDDARRWIAEAREAAAAGLLRRTRQQEAKLSAEVNRGRAECGTWLDPEEVDALINQHRM